MTPVTAVDSVAVLEPIGLEVLVGIAALQTRRDRKYVVPRDLIERLIEEAAPGTRVLDVDGLRAFRYESVYFDTPDLVAYLAAARSRPRRFKVRTRSYLDSEECVLEVKTRRRDGMTVKHRHPYPIHDRARLTDDGAAFVGAFDSVGTLGRRLRPTLTTRYRRTTLLDTASMSRITIDMGLECVTPDGAAIALADHVLVETKSGGAPTSVDRLLWSYHRRPVKISKYGTGLAALCPELPANKWNRVLRTHFAQPRRPEPTASTAAG